MLVFRCTWILCGVFHLSWQTATVWPSSSSVQKQHGHYPGNLCILTETYLNLTDRTFHYNSNEDLHSKMCPHTTKVWDLRHSPDPGQVECNQFFDVGYIYTVFYYQSTSNYYHLHWDMLLPLYHDIYYSDDDDDNDGEESPKLRLAFMPSVEASRLQVYCIMAEKGHTITCKPDSRVYVYVYRPRRDCTPPHVNRVRLCLCIYTNVKVYIQKC